MRIAAICVLSCLVSLPSLAQADESRAGKLSLGIIGGFHDVMGGEIAYRAGESFGIRGGVSGFSNSGIEITEEFDGSFETLAGFGFVDWYPFLGGMRFSAGSHVGEMVLDVKDNVSADGTILNGYVKANEFRPSLSVGYVTPGRLQFSADAGITYFGEPEISANLAGETEFVSEIEDYEVLPFAHLGIAYRF